MTYRHVAFAAVAVCMLGALTLAQTPVVPRPPFTARDAERGVEIAKKSFELRGQIVDNLDAVEPFKIAGNLYFIGVQNGDTFLLTSPRGHIMIGAGFVQTAGLVEKNIEKLGFKVADVKAILINHHHGNQSGGAAYFRQKTGAQVMIGFADIATIERMNNAPPGAPGAAGGRGAPGGAPGAGDGGARGARGGRGAPPAAAGEPNPFGPFTNFSPALTGANAGQQPVKVDRALFDGDVIRVGPLAVTAYSNPLHTLGSMTFAFTVREGGRDLKAAQYCCWELGDNFSGNPNVSEAVFQKVLELHRKLAPVDIYLESGTYGWGGVVNQPSGTWAERFAKLRTDNKLFVNRDIFAGLAAAREVYFQQNMVKFKAANPNLN